MAQLDCSLSASCTCVSVGWTCLSHDRAYWLEAPCSAAWPINLPLQWWEARLRHRWMTGIPLRLHSCCRCRPGRSLPGPHPPSLHTCLCSLRRHALVRTQTPWDSTMHCPQQGIHMATRDPSHISTAQMLEGCCSQEEPSQHGCMRASAGQMNSADSHALHDEDWIARCMHAYTNQWFEQASAAELQSLTHLQGCVSLQQSLTFDLSIVCLRLPHQQGRCFPIQGVSGVGIQQQLRQERLKHIEQICIQQGLAQLAFHATAHISAGHANLTLLHSGML